MATRSNATTQPLTKRDIEKATPKPPMRFPDIDRIPQALKDCAQWVVWDYRWINKRWTKRPFFIDLDEDWGCLKLHDAMINKPATWMSFNNALLNYGALNHEERLYSASGEGVILGLEFAVSDADPFCAIDLDDCRNKLTGAITPEAQQIIDRFNSYTEVSPSGTGVKIYFRGKKPGPKCKHSARGIEIYDQKRFLAVTGDLLRGMPDDLMDRQEELDSLYHELFPEPVREPGSSSSWSNGQTPPPPLPCDLGDEEILDKATHSRTGDRFYALWCGSTLDHNGDASKADYALASSLAFWVGPDPARIQSLMMRSGLRREKWTQRKDYLPRTIQAAIKNRTSWYEGRRNHLPQPDPLPQVEEDEGGYQARVDQAVARLSPEKIAQRKQDAEALRATMQAKLEAAREAARAVAAARAADNDSFHCSHCRPILMRARSEGETRRSLVRPYVIWARCQSWLCTGCRNWLIFREMAAVKVHFRQADALYEFGCTEEQWESMRQRIRRAGGEYHRTRDGAGWYVVTSAHIRGSIPVTADMAISVVRTLLEDWCGDHRPITTSHDWGLVKEHLHLDLERVGMCHPTLTVHKMSKIAEAFDGWVRSCNSTQDRPSQIVQAWRIDRRTGWDPQAFDRFAASLFAGEVVTSLPVDCWYFDDEVTPQRRAWATTIEFDLALTL